MSAPAEGTTADPRPEFAPSLQTIVELVRRIMHADVASILGFSLVDETVTWKAATGFTVPVDYLKPVMRPLGSAIARRALEANTIGIIQGIGTRPEFPAESFLVHTDEGVCDLAVAPLRILGNSSGALVAGYRRPHQFTDDEKKLLQNLAEMAAVVLDNDRLLDAATAAEERFRGVVEAAPSAMIMVDEDGRMALVNAQTERLFGYPRTELLGKPVEMLVPERYGSAHTEHRESFLQQPSARAMGAGRDLFGRRKDGSEVPIEIGLNPIQTDEGAFVLADIIDITQRKETEADLRASEERARRGQKIWEQTFDAIGEGILVHDYQMQIVRCNARAAEMLEMQPADVIGLSFSEVFARLFGKRAAAYYLAEDRGAYSVFEVETESGSRYLVSIFPLPLRAGDSVSVVTWTDVTRFLEIKEQLSRSRRLASVGELAAGVAHEINNPLAAITTCAEATIRDIRQNDETQALAERHQWSYYLEEIVRQALRCKEITRGLLDLTRQRPAHRVMCDLNAIAAQCAKVALQRAGTSVIEFEINLDEKASEVATDAALVRQILDNLLSNAIDALGEQGGRISVSTIRDGDRVAVEVADTGQGIPPDLVAKVFDPFFSTKGPGKGYGLGLPISLTLAESLGGALSVESKEGAGSRFRLWIPRKAPEAQG
jgi:PAS domain S-box-containing protein